MKKNNRISSCLLSLAWLVTVHSCSPASHTANLPNTVEVLSAHKTVAILPVEVHFAKDIQKLKKFSDAELIQLNQYFSLALQKHLAEEIADKQKKFPYTVTLQPVETTNQLLSNNKISFGALFSSNKQTFCSLLQTDAVIETRVLFGLTESLEDIAGGGKLEMRFAIFDSRQPAAAWTYTRTASRIPKVLFTENVLATPFPPIYYGGNDKFEKMMVPWIPAIDKLFGHFTADCPYKKRNNF